MTMDLDESSQARAGQQPWYRRVLSKEFAFLEQPLPLGSRLLTVAAALMLIFVFIYPLWNMTFYSNQYTDGLALDIYAYHLRAEKPPIATTFAR